MLYPVCSCGHRYDHHRDNGDPRGPGCWLCLCKRYEPATGIVDFEPTLKVLENRYVELRSLADGSLLRTASFNGISHIVVPIVTAVGDNVWWPANAPTPELVPASVLAAHAFSRNNRPVVMGHPKSDGEYCSANDPKILEEYGFGQMFASEFDNGRIKVEAWLDPVRATTVGPDAVRVIERLQAGEQVEVSEGDYVVTKVEKGEFGGKTYGAVWVSAVSDHLAMLPVGDIGACSNEMGCGGPRVSVLRSNMVAVGERHEIRTSATSQARTPTYTGTESVKWAKPSFSEYIKYLDDSSEPPKTVGQCSTTLKAKITAHTLLGDPSASTFADLSALAVVNPANGKLNERALRAITAGRSLAADISESALASAQEVARRLLNSEFSGLSASSNSEEEIEMKSNQNIFKRMLAKIRTSMSNNDLRWKLFEAVSELEPGVQFVDDEDVAKGTFRYDVMIRFGYSWEDNSEMQYHTYQRTFTIDAGGAVTVNDDRVELIYNEDKAWAPLMSSNVSEPAVEARSNSESQECQCHKGDETMKPNQTQKDLASKLITSSASPFEESDRTTLESMDEKKLQTLADTYEKPAAGVVEPAPVAPVTPVPATVTASASTASASTAVATGQRILTEEEYSTLKSAADAFQAAQRARKAHLVTSLKAACGTAFTEADLNVLDMSVLEKLAVSHHIDAPASADYSVRGIPSSALSLSEADKLKAHKPSDTWGLALAKKQQRAGTNDRAN